MATTFQDIVTNFMIFGLIVFAMFSYVVISQHNNDAPQPIIENSLFNNQFLINNLLLK